MTLFRYDDDLLTGMHAASTVGLSCADAMSTDASLWTTEDRQRLQPAQVLPVIPPIFRPVGGRVPRPNSTGPKKTLTNISTSLLSQPGTSSDIPVVHCTQFLYSTTDYVE